MDSTLIRKLSIYICLCVLSSCTTTSTRQQTEAQDVPPLSSAEQNQLAASPVVSPYFIREPVVQDEAEPVMQNLEPRTSIRKGTGKFVNDDKGKASVSEAASKDVKTGNITLNFREADLNEFVRVVFEEILQQNYLIDPKINGKVTLQTTSPVTDDSILPIMESVLQLNGAALVFQQGIYRVIPLEDAPGQVDAQLADYEANQGISYAVQIVPLRYVAAKEIEKIITPLVSRGSSVRIDEARNLLIISGPRYRLEKILDTVQIFDVDWFKGMSFGLFRLQYAEAATLVKELEPLLGTEGNSPLAGIVRLTPIERLNAVLVITHAPRYIDEVSKLINQFDWGTESAPGRRLYVYHLKNSKADKLASVLQQIYQTGDSDMASVASAKISQVPPGELANVFRSAEKISTKLPPPGGFKGSGGGYSQPTPLDNPATKQGVNASAADGTDVDQASSNDISIIAEQDSNALLVMASARDYRGIEAIIKQLDVPPRQVLIEATIAEVTLSDSLSYGVRWFLSGGTTQLGFNAPVPTSAGGDGLTFSTFSNSSDARLFIDLLASKTSVKFLSAPQVMVLDNHTANIRVGDQIPVTVRSSQSTVNPDAPVVSEVQFRDTGTLLSVTPRINAGGQITLEISQEVSLPGSEPAIGGGGNVAISQRTIDSSVVVQSGETVLLGGLILETHSDNKSGIPFLMDLPWIGNLFSTTTDSVFRTELIVMITPQVLVDENGTQAIINEMRNKMKKVIEFGNSVESIEL